MEGGGAGAAAAAGRGCAGAPVAGAEVKSGAVKSPGSVGRAGVKSGWRGATGEKRAMSAAAGATRGD
jgi:hypothetical protein